MAARPLSPALVLDAVTVRQVQIAVLELLAGLGLSVEQSAMFLVDLAASGVGLEGGPADAFARLQLLHRRLDAGASASLHVHQRGKGDHRCTLAN